MKKIIPTLFLIVAASRVGVACTCFDPGSFCESIGYVMGLYQKMPTVVHAQVESRNSEGAEFSILQVLGGSGQPGTRFTIGNGNCVSCIVSTDEFEVGGEFLLILGQPLDEPQWLSCCGTFYLPVENGVAKGFVSPDRAEVRLADFPSLMDCGEMYLLQSFDMALQPNLLVNTDLYAHPIDWAAPTNVIVRIFNPLGQVLLEKKWPGYDGSGPLPIPTEDLAAGMYYCQFQFGGRSVTRGFVKLRGG